MNNNYINIKQTPTAWVFLLSCASDNEDRHLLDLAWALKSLIAININKKDIFIYIDSKITSENIKGYLSINTLKFEHKCLKEYVETSKDFFDNYENVVFFVLGHGNKRGLDSFHAITPYILIDKIKNMSKPKNAILYLGQCYSGIFNYLDVGIKNKEGVNLSIIGATGLNLSLSAGVTDKLYVGKDTTWLANIFMYNLFKWFSKPQDIDGDTKFSIIDSYKYTEMEMNEILKKISENLLYNIGDLHGKRSNYQLLLNNPNIDYNQKNALIAEIDAVESEISQKLNIFSVKQESWLLNANHIRNIGI